MDSFYLYINQSRCGIMSNYEKLLVWQRAVDLGSNIYVLTRKKPLSLDFSLRDQMRRSAVSIASNIAEGDELDTDKQAIRHFFIAKGSIAELRTQLIIAGRAYHDIECQSSILSECIEISSMLMGLIKSRKRL